MKRKPSFIVIAFLAPFFIFSCSLFGSNGDTFSCQNLVVMDETGSLVEYQGDPSDQWKVSGIQPEYANLLKVNAAYPNPTTSRINIQYEIPDDMQVRVRVKGSNGDYDQIIVDNTQQKGSYTTIANLSESSSKCFRADFYFAGSESSNAYGLIKKE